MEIQVNANTPGLNKYAVNFGVKGGTVLPGVGGFI